MKMIFGWEDDGGIGDLLVQHIIDGKKSATCGFKVEYTKQELEDLKEVKGNIVTVENYRGEPKCNIRIVDVFETTFGNPDIRLIKGEGYGENIEEFQKDHRHAWAQTIKNKQLNNDTVLIVELFELVEVID